MKYMKTVAIGLFLGFGILALVASCQEKPNEAPKNTIGITHGN